MSYRIENKDIVIDGWDKGISSSPYEGISDMRCVDPVTVPGEVSVAMATQSMQTQGAITNAVFTVDAGTDVFSYDGVVPLEINTAIIFSNSGGALPAGLSATAAYYVKTTPTPTTFTVSAVSAGGVVKDVTDVGSGTNKFTTIQMGTPSFYANCLVSKTYWQYFMADSNGRVWLYCGSALTNTGKWVYTHNQGDETSLTPVCGMSCYKNYLFVANNNYLDVISIIDWVTATPTLAHLTTYASWIKSWKVIATNANTTSIRDMLVGQDDILYICADNNLASVDEIDGSLVSNYGQAFSLAETHSNTHGDTTDGTTTITTTPFFTIYDVGAVITGTNIPTGAYITERISSTSAKISLPATGTGNNLTFTITKSYAFNQSALALPPNEIATCMTELGGKLLIGGIGNYIYPWDRISTSFDYPIYLSELRTSKMVTVNTTTYIFVGHRGRIYMTNGSNVSLFWKMPDYLSKTTSPYYFVTSANFNRNQLYFGLKTKNNAGTTINENGGLWVIDLNSNCARCENRMSYGTYSGYVNCMTVWRGNTVDELPQSDGYGLLIGWNNGSIGGIDKQIATPYTGGEAYVSTDIIPVGQFLTKKTFENVEYKLAVPLVAGESVALYYSSDINSTQTSIPMTQGNGTGDLSGIGGVTFENCQWIKITAFLTSTATNPSYVRLKEIRIR